jgi:hypothetical protein
MRTRTFYHTTKILSLTGTILAFHTIFCLAGNIAFTYDGAGRLSRADFAANKSIAYTYDKAGNLLQRAFSVGAVSDTDGDGLDDAWEIQYFGNLSRNGTGDFDGDGLSDLNEFLAGTDPTNSASTLRITGASRLPNPTIQWQSVPGKQYRVQFKNSLSDSAWTDISGDVTATGSTAAKVDNTQSAAARFYRVMLAP